MTKKEKGKESRNTRKADTKTISPAKIKKNEVKLSGESWQEILKKAEMLKREGQGRKVHYTARRECIVGMMREALSVPNNTALADLFQVDVAQITRDYSFIAKRDYGNLEDEARDHLDGLLLTARQQVQRLFVLQRDLIKKEVIYATDKQGKAIRDEESGDLIPTGTRTYISNPRQYRLITKNIFDMTMKVVDRMMDLGYLKRAPIEIKGRMTMAQLVESFWDGKDMTAGGLFEVGKKMEVAETAGTSAELSDILN